MKHPRSLSFYSESEFTMTIFEIRMNKAVAKREQAYTHWTFNPGPNAWATYQAAQAVVLDLMRGN